MAVVPASFEGLVVPTWFRTAVAEHVAQGRALGDELLALGDHAARREHWIGAVHPVPPSDVTAAELDVVRSANASLDDPGRVAAKAYAKYGLVSSRLNPDSPWVQALRAFQGHAGPADAARAEHQLATGSDEIVDMLAAVKSTHPEIRPELALDPSVDPASVPLIMRDSHPSGHATLGGYAAELLGPGLEQRLGDATWARVAYTAHYPHDVLEGVRLGTAWARVRSAAG